MTLPAVTSITNVELRNLAAAAIEDLADWYPELGLTEPQTIYSKAASPQIMLAVLDLVEKLTVELAELRGSSTDDDIPDFTPGQGNKARRRAAALGIDMDASMRERMAVPVRRTWREIAEPVPEADRLCRTPQCWCCEGTGRDPAGGLCSMNDGIPF